MIYLAATLIVYAILRRALLPLFRITLAILGFVAIGVILSTNWLH
jgi:hypothetical protein